MDKEMRGSRRKESKGYSLERLPRTLDAGDCYKVNLNKVSSQGYIKEAYNDKNER